MNRGSARIPYFEQRFFCQNNSSGGISPSFRHARSRGSTCSRNISSAHEPADDIAFDLLFIDDKIGDNVDISLTAPPLSLWFHGKLDRLTAEKRLLASAKPGCYLIRESDRRSNTYVLSYLGVQGINHFKIAAVCGEFFIGGRKFDSLSHLVGFYTSCSDLLQNGRLVHPVVPSEPVKDNKRVIALHPYTKVIDSDELSFIRGDILTVQNDLSQYAEGWLWCSNLRTFESGLVFKDLVVEIDDEELDTNELFPWYHSSISKEEAVDRLAKMGPGSFLVRKSERSPGNFSLFFHINNTVQRFRIERLGNRYIMGGRTFDSLDAVIKRYQHEQIVEGYCLGDPVLRAPIQLTIPTILRKGFSAVISAANSSQTVSCATANSALITTGEPAPLNSVAASAASSNNEDVYATLRESRENAKKNQSVWMRGFLFKKSLKSGKWKYLHFALNAKDQQLCFYENEKRVKPKGLVDLSYTFLYPVHDSLFDRSFCFQLVERTIPCISTFYYLSADSAESAMEWVQALKPLCAPQQSKNHRSPSSSSNICHTNLISAGNEITEVRTLYVTLCQAYRLPVKLLPHPYCLISLNQVKVARTQVKCPPDPLWEEDFILEEIPIDVASFSVILLNKRKESKSTEVASLELELTSLNNGEEVEKCFNLNGLQTPLRDDYGSIRLRIRYVHEVIMPFREYTILKELLMNSDLQVISILEEFCHRDRGPLAHALLRIFRFERKETQLIRVMIEREISRETETNTLFRMDSLTTALMDQYMRSTCESFVAAALKDPLKRIVDAKQSCELNPTKLDKLEEVCANAEHLLSLLDAVIDSIFRSVDSCPAPIRFICGCLQRACSAKWPNDPLVKTRVVGSFIFLRLLCPAIVNPRDFALCDDTPSETAARNMILIAKCLQNLANLVEFGIKNNYCSMPTFAPVCPSSILSHDEDEADTLPPGLMTPMEPWMEIVNPFILKNKSRVIKFLDDIANVYEVPEAENSARGDPARELATIHTICEIHLSEISALSHARPTLKKLAFVTELLSKHRNRCLLSSAH